MLFCNLKIFVQIFNELFLKVIIYDLSNISILKNDIFLIHLIQVFYFEYHFYFISYIHYMINLLSVQASIEYFLY